MKGKVIVAPNYRKIIGPLIFLGGPRAGTGRWQDRAIDIIHSINREANIASPRRHPELDNLLSHSEMDDDQMKWDDFYLERAAKKGGIMFWLAEEDEHNYVSDYAQISRFMLGKWMVRYQRDKFNFVLGVENGFPCSSYIRKSFARECPDIKIYSSISDACRVMLDKIYPDEHNLLSEREGKK